MYWRKRSNDHPYRYSLDAARDTERGGCMQHDIWTVITFALDLYNASKENEKLLAFRIALVFVGRWDTVVVAAAAVEKKKNNAHCQKGETLFTHSQQVKGRVDILTIKCSRRCS